MGTQLEEQVAVFADPRGRILLRELPQEDGFAAQHDMDVLQTGSLVHVLRYDVSGVWARVQRRDGGGSSLSHPARIFLDCVAEEANDDNYH